MIKRCKMLFTFVEGCLQHSKESELYRNVIDWVLMSEIKMCARSCYYKRYKTSEVVDVFYVEKFEEKFQHVK